MDAFGAIKIVMSIVFSAFIIIMVYNFATSYMDVNTAKKQATVLRDFEKTVRDVYVNGIPANFTIDGDLFKSIKVFRPPQLVTSIGTVDFGYVPLFFVKGRKLSITRARMDIDWWKFDYVIALPKTTVIYVPLSNSNDVWDTIKMITGAFSDTENIEPVITFGFGCNETFYFHLNKWKRDIFMENVPFIQTMIDYEDECIDEIDGEDKKVIIIANELSDFSKGVLIVPKGPYWGKMYTNVSGNLKEYSYRDGLDILALVLGGEEFLKYKNNMYLTQLKVAAKLKYDELQLLKSKSARSECGALYSTFMPILSKIYEFNDADYDDDFNGIMFAEQVRASADQQKKLEEMGCD
ncbi:MAG: hypothetical protein GXO64_01625 [Candidatus Micrarchaeota archaeon]|nr:hypothetical protein [Candidatus Micrarchaeota archaeon]